MKIGKIKNLTMQQQVQMNMENIEELAKVIKNVYNTQETLTTASTTIDVSDIVDWDTNTETGLILSKDGLLFDIVAVVDSTVYIKYWANVKGPQGNTGSTGATGATGNGIVSITKTDTTGLVDTYTVLFTNGNTTTFTVTNGQDGADGQTGATGNGIASVSKTGTVGLVDTYTITFTNGQTTTFDVTNGANGTNGTNGQDGADFTALTYKGQWTSGTDYNKFDLVYVEASSIRKFYMALNNITNSTISPDLDTTNFKEMFEIPVSSSAVKSAVIKTYSELTTLLNNGAHFLYGKFENVSGQDQNYYSGHKYEITFDVTNSNISSITETSEAGYFMTNNEKYITSDYSISNTAVAFYISNGSKRIFFNSSGVITGYRGGNSYTATPQTGSFKFGVNTSSGLTITTNLSSGIYVFTLYYI